MLQDLSGRYLLNAELGRGSVGVVYRAQDLILGRAVAIKCLRPELKKHERHRHRFLREASICAQLSHPNIVVAYDQGCIDLPDNKALPCLVMSLLEGRPLRSLLHRSPQSRLLSWFARVCEGLAYAHDHGVIHRDLKPAHIFVGEYGQVVLTDWGLAKIKSEQAPILRSRDVTRIGDVLGTPAYMAPEQAEGRLERIDHRTDIYALGAILYEILTGTRPYEGSRAIEVIRAVRRGELESPSQRASHREISPELEALCLQAMARDPKERFQSALDLAVNIEEYQAQPSLSLIPAERRDTIKQLLPPKNNPSVGAGATEALTDGRADAAAFERLLEQAELLENESAREEALLPYEASPEERRPAWRKRASALERREQAAWHLSQAVIDLRRAEEEYPEQARDALAHLHLAASRDARGRGDLISALFHRARAEHFDTGALTPELGNRATLSIYTQPKGVIAELSKLDCHVPVWSPGALLRLGSTPLSERTVSATRLILRLIAPDGLVFRLPLNLQPGESRLLELSLPHSNHVPPGFLFIPGGRFLFGADSLAPGAASARAWDLNSFCIARQPVCWESYFEFLEDLIAVGADARPHLPRSREGPLVYIRSNRVHWRSGQQVAPGSPICSVSHTDAMRYAEWLGRRLGMHLRLPSEVEWSYAGGCADGRCFPWGDRFVPGLADARRRGATGPAPLSQFPGDESPFGMRSVAGSVREWTSTPADVGGRYILRGGSWRAWPDRCRLGARVTGATDLTHRAVGIRLAADIPSADSNESLRSR